MLGFANILAQPLMLRPEAKELFRDVLAMLDTGREAPAVASAFRGKPVRGRNDAPLYNLENGAAIVTIVGPTVNRGAWMGSRWGVTSYEGIAAQLDAAVSDPSVTRIVLDVDSPGGEAAGAFSLGEKVRAVSKRKSVTAFVNGCACSAGYAIACGAERIVVTPSAVVGSIGVLLVHMDHSRRLEQAGIRPTIIHAGARKVDGSPVRPLSEDARASLQRQVDKLHGMFVAEVAKHRRMAAAAVRATEARVFMGAGAVQAGLADVVGTLDDALGTAGAATPRSSPTSSITPRAPAVTVPAPPAARIDPTRLSAILALPEAKGFEHSACRLAAGPAPIEQVQQELAAMGKAVAEARQIVIDETWTEAMGTVNAEAARHFSGVRMAVERSANASIASSSAQSASADDLWDSVIEAQNARLGVWAPVAGSDRNAPAKPTASQKQSDPWDETIDNINRLNGYRRP